MYSIRTSKGSAINSQRHWLELSDNWRWNQRKGNEKLLLPFKQFCHYSVLLAHILVLLSYSLLFRFSPGKIPVPWVYPFSLGVPLFAHVTRNSKQDSNTALLRALAIWILETLGSILAIFLHKKSCSFFLLLEEQHLSSAPNLLKIREGNIQQSYTSTNKSEEGY